MIMYAPLAFFAAKVGGFHSSISARVSGSILAKYVIPTF